MLANIYSIGILILLVSLNASSAHTLTAVYLNSKLPGFGACKLPYYDGYDSIYLFDGCRLRGESDVLLFTISTGTIVFFAELMGKVEKIPVRGDGKGNILFLRARDFQV